MTEDAVIVKKEETGGGLEIKTTTLYGFGGLQRNHYFDCTFCGFM